MGNLQNIDLSDFQSFLFEKGLKVIRTKGGHEIWSRKDLKRPVVLQSHISPIPEFIVVNNLKTIGSTKKELLEFLMKD
jgi:hypothetical protein